MSDCVFCKVAAGEIPATKLHEDDEVVAFRDISPQAPVHVLVVPRRHVRGIAETAAADVALLGRLVAVARDIAAREGLDRTGYRVVINNGESAGQSVFHLHVHLLGGRPMGWPPG